MTSDSCWDLSVRCWWMNWRHLTTSSGWKEKCMSDKRRRGGGGRSVVSRRVVLWKQIKVKEIKDAASRGAQTVLTGHYLLFCNMRLNVDSAGESVRGRTLYPATIIKLNSPPPLQHMHTRHHHTHHHHNNFGSLIHTLTHTHTHTLRNPIIPLQIENTFKIRCDYD